MAPTFKVIPSKEDLMKLQTSLVGRMNTKDGEIKNKAKQDSDLLKKYRSIIYPETNIRKPYKKKGKGINRYNQPRRNAYKIS